MQTKPFKTKIPIKYHEQIFEWYSNGLNRTAIMIKLNDEFQFHCNERTLGKLLAYLKNEKKLAVSAIITDQAHKNALGDFNKLEDLYSDVAEIAKLAHKVDNNLYLRATDRLLKIIQVRNHIEAKEIDSETSFDEEDAIKRIAEMIDK